MEDWSPFMEDIEKHIFMKKITSETPNSVIEETPISEIPQEIKDYYARNGYWRGGRAFSAKIVKEIAKIIEVEERTSDYDENMTFEKLTSFPNAPLW